MQITARAEKKKQRRPDALKQKPASGPHPDRKEQLAKRQQSRPAQRQEAQFSPVIEKDESTFDRKHYKITLRHRHTHIARSPGTNIFLWASEFSSEEF